MVFEKLKSKENIVVIGGGIGGLYAANQLIENYENVTLIEKNDQLGGLARSINYKDGYIEKFYHYYGPETPHMFELLDELKFNDRLVWTKVSRASFINGNIYPFEKKTDLLKFNLISFYARLKLGLMILKTRYFIKWKSIDELYASDWLIKEIGQKAYDILWKPLLELKFKEYTNQIPAPFIWSRIKIQQEKIAYIKGGLNDVIDALEKKIKDSGVKIRKNTSVEKIVVKNNKVNGILLKTGEIIKTKKVLTTVPSPLLNSFCEFKSPEKELIDEKDWMGVVCAVLLVKNPITPYMWLNVTSEKIPFVGVIDYTHLNPEYLINGNRIIYIPDYVSTGHEHYNMGKDQLLKKVFDSLKIINPNFSKEWVEEAFVFKAPYAQNIPFRNFGKRIIPNKSMVEGLFIADWSQFYPWDRGLSNSIKIAKSAVSKIIN
jgi:protoporphyrinogen oxidase